MKKLIFPLLAVALLVDGCEKVNEFDGERPDTRVADHLQAYSDLLVGAENGWLGYLFPEGGGGYTFKFSFNDQNRVIMYANMNGTYAATAKESSYRLRASQTPSLFFDTYSYLHELADPDPDVSGGPAGAGQLSDFEFTILSATTDTVRLKGNLNGSELLLIRANAAQGDDYISRVYAYNEQLDKLAKFPNYYNRLTIGGADYQFTLNTRKNTVSFQLPGDQDSATFYTEYASLDNGIVLRKGFDAGSTHITALTDFEINSTQHSATVQAGGTTANLTNEANPIATDIGAAMRMYIQPYSYTSDHAFTIAGQANGLGLGEIPGYEALYYLPRRFIDGYDAFYIIYDQGFNYVGPALQTRISNDGTMYFEHVVGYDGTDIEGLDEQSISRVIQLTQQLTTPVGYRVYQTGKTSYDLVSVADSRVWIRFY